MIAIENHLGTIHISLECLTSLIAHTAESCFGVAGMNPKNVRQSLLNALPFKKKKCPEKGINVQYNPNKNKLSIDMHIMVLYGTNISAIVDSIIHKVRYTVEEATGIMVSKINVFVDSMTA